MGVANHSSARRLVDANASLVRSRPAAGRARSAPLINPHMGYRKLSARLPATFTWPSIDLRHKAGIGRPIPLYAALLSTPCSICTRRLQNSEISVSE